METVYQFFQGMLSLCSCDAIYRRVLLLVCSINRKTIDRCIQFSLSRENDDDVRDIGKHDFRSVPMLSNSNPLKLFSYLVASGAHP